jgi:acetyltransferase (isoleucine patch superfamily)
LIKTFIYEFRIKQIRIQGGKMTELEKLKTGLEYNFYDEEVAGVKGNALKKCQILNSIDPMNSEKQLAAIKDLFGTVKNNASVQPFLTVIMERIFM